MKTVLVVDDEQAIRESIRMILEYEGFAVRFASQGSEALQDRMESIGTSACPSVGCGLDGAAGGWLGRVVNCQVVLSTLLPSVSATLTYQS